MNEQTIFTSAVERDASQRPAFLDSVCGSDHELRRRVERLLELHQYAGSFLEHPAAGVADTVGELVRERPGCWIGPYHLLEQIGEGGMGAVYLAEQKQPVRRKVALKVIKPGMDTRQVVARFEAERQALAMMNHSSIAKVLDAGATEAGRPYFVMELVKGLPITEFCDQHQLTTREQLELFVTVCQAVQHAHQKGLIHRDLKPSNVLVEMHDVVAVPKVIDFGVAKAIGHSLTEKTLHTAFSQMVGTPLYMSPEQAGHSSIDVDTRSDIYSLGVLLYEMLTGSTPFDRNSLESVGFDEMRRMIREVEPPRPSARISTLQAQALSTVSDRRQVEPRKLSQQLRGELDWIVMKALEKDRNRRYETANGFAADVQRYLDDEPVLACPPSARYRFGKFALRNRAVLVATGVVAASLVLGVMISTWQAIRATRAEGLAYAAQQQAVANLKAAQENEMRSMTEADRANAVIDLLQKMLASANPDEAKGADYTVRQLLDEFSAGLDGQLQGQPEVEADIRATIGNAYRRLNMTAKAEPHLLRALSLRRSLLDHEDEAIAQSMLDYGWNLSGTGRPAEAEQYARQALSIYKRRDRQGAKVLEAMSSLQLFLDGQFKYQEAEVVANEALAFGRERFSEGHPELANVLHRLAAPKIVQGKFLESERLAREAVEMHRRWHGKDHVETAWALRELAGAMKGQGRLNEAAGFYREALAIFQNQNGDDHISVIRTFHALEEALRNLGDSDGLRALKLQRLATISRIAGRDVEDAEGLMHLCILYAEIADWGKAISCCERAIELGRDAAPELRFKHAQSCSKLATLHHHDAAQGGLPGPVDHSHPAAGNLLQQFVVTHITQLLTRTDSLIQIVAKLPNRIDLKDSCTELG